MNEYLTLIEDLCDLKGCITGRSSHVDLTVNEQCDHHRPLGHATPEKEPSHECFVGQGVNHYQTGYLSVAPEMYYAARPAECSSTVSPKNHPQKLQMLKSKPNEQTRMTSKRFKIDTKCQCNMIMKSGSPFRNP